MLDVAEHDDEEAITVTELRYEDQHSPSDSAALRMLFRSDMTWERWALVVDALPKVFKGYYVHLFFDVMLTLPRGKVKILGTGALYDPKYT